MHIDLQFWRVELSVKGLAILVLMVSGWVLFSIAEGFFQAYRLVWEAANALHRFSVKLCYRWFGEFGFTYRTDKTELPQDRRIRVPLRKVHLN